MPVKGSLQSRFCFWADAAQCSKGVAEIEQRKFFDVIDHETKVAFEPK